MGGVERKFLLCFRRPSLFGRFGTRPGRLLYAVSLAKSPYRRRSTGRLTVSDLG